MEKQWKAGDKVRLVSGGPEMTVHSQVTTEFEGESVHCQWFDKEGKIHRDNFAPESLVGAK
jgi:uncharacterized protein YodC (DUF2158 family)